MKLIPLVAVLSLFGAMPAPADTSLPPWWVQRIFIGFDVAAGHVEVAVHADLCIARLNGGVWTEPMPLSALNALDPGDGGAVAGVTFCIAPVVSGPSPWAAAMASTPVMVEIEEQAPSLDQAVAKAHEKLVTSIPSGWNKVPCNQ